MFDANLARIRGFSDDSPEYQALMADSLKWWEGLHEMADTNQDDQISPEEWMTYWDAFLTGVSSEIGQDQTPMQDRFHESVVTVFDTIDENQDGIISLREYSNFLKAHEVETDYEAAFKQIVTNDGDVISREDATRLLREFFFSNDPTSPGNYVFGPDF